MIPDPQENTTLFSSIIPILANFSFIIFFSEKVLSFWFIISPKGKLYEFLIEPLLIPGLGSFSKPKNLFLLLASTNLNFFWYIFFFTSFLFLTSRDTFFALSSLTLGSNINKKIGLLISSLAASYSINQLGNISAFNLSILKKHLNHIFK